MSKVLNGLVGSAVVAGGLFYFGSQKLIADEIDNHIAMLQNNGFMVEEKTKDSDGEHFIISLADLHKFAKLIPEYEKILLAEDKSALKDFKLSVNITTSGSVVSADIYPISLPTAGKLKSYQEKIEKLIQDKTLLLHVNYDSITENFDGNFKDINEKEVIFKGVSFDGNFNTDKLALKYDINRFKIENPDNNKPILDAINISSDTIYEGFNYYISNGYTKLEKLTFNSPTSTDIVTISDINIDIISDESNGLLNSSLKTLISSVDTTINNKHINLDTVTFDYGIKNINMEAFEKLTKVLDQTNPNFKSPEVQESIQEIISQGIEIDIDSLGFKNLSYDGESLDGFGLQTNWLFKKDPDLFQKLQTSPTEALSLMELTSKIKISDKIFDKLLTTPKGRMLGMVQPQQENGYKVYDLELKNGSLTVNNQPMM